MTFTLFFAILQFFCVSCEKMIDVDIPDNQIPTDLVFENVQTADAALAGLYGGLWDDSPLAGDQTGKLLGTYTDDLSNEATTSTDGLLELYQNLHTDSNPAIYAYWAAAYQKIYVANAIMEGIEKSSSLSVEDKNRMKGEALLVRSILFFYLEQIFGDIPLPLTTDYTINASLSKTDYPQVLNKIGSDLTESISLVADEYRNVERIYPNRKVAQLMLAKVLMLQNRWAEAEVLLKEIAQSPLYTFENDITKVFNKSGSHIIWQLKPKNPGDATKELIAYYFANAAPSTVALSEDLVNVFSTGDLRKENWIAQVSIGGNTWYRADKYKNMENNMTEYSIVLRLEEVYLLLAESLAQQGKVNEALLYVNPTRQRAGLLPINAPISKAMLLNEIVLENRKEFFTEMGHRFFDLKRLNRLQTLLPVKPNFKDFHAVWPIPQKEILLNPNLNPQNAGY